MASVPAPLPSPCFGLRLGPTLSGGLTTQQTLQEIWTGPPVLIVEQGPVGTSYGGFLADEIQRRLMDWLDQPVQRVHGAEAAPTISKVLERAAFAGTEEVMHGIAVCMAGKGMPVADNERSKRHPGVSYPSAAWRGVA